VGRGPLPGEVTTGATQIDGQHPDPRFPAPGGTCQYYENGCPSAADSNPQLNYSRVVLARGATLTCAEAVRPPLKDKRRWEVRSAGKGSKKDRWYGWVWLATASLRHHLLVRRHLKTGELAFHHCYVPEGQVLTLIRLVCAAGLRWPVEEDSEFGKDCFGLDESQVRHCTAIARHTVLVMVALAICAITAALLRDRTDTQAPPPIRRLISPRHQIPGRSR